VDNFVASVEVGSPTVVRLRGELDLASVPELHAALAGLSGTIELECSALRFIDACGIGAFVTIHQACSERGDKLVICNPRPLLERMLDIVELEHYFEVRFDESSA